LEVEGGTKAECLRLLRHETGHAIQHAFNLHRRKKWRALFGSSTTPYPDYYRPNPGSRRYVVHLPYWYAQSHPDEDFAETFAVWLTPRSTWKRDYKGWRALQKLQYVDELMQELAGKAPPVKSRARPDPIHRIKTTLGDHYQAKRARYDIVSAHASDRDLFRLFAAPAKNARRGIPAARFLRSHRGEIRRLVARSTGKHELALDSVLGEMIARTRELKLRAVGRKRQLVIDLAILLSARSAEFGTRGRDWHAL
ncbi:MAG: putative zinc-binding metallopeptidase, partial [Myxococcota bacterium]